MSNESIKYLIETYTYEAGVRKLKEKLYELFREINLKYLNNDIKLPFTISKDFIENLFKNYPKFKIKKISNIDKVGVINGLYATSAGIGGITIIETYKKFSNNFLDLELTGQQGDVMKESMKVAKTLAWNIIPKSNKDELHNVQLW